MRIYNLLAVVILLPILFSCESDNVRPYKKEKLEKIKISSLSQEPYLEGLLDKINFRSAFNGRTNGNGLTINIDSILMVLQVDSLSYSYTFQVNSVENSPNVFTNLVLKKVIGGFNVFYLKYESQSPIIDIKKFTGKVTSYNLSWEPITVKYFLNGQLTEDPNLGGRVNCSQSVVIEKICLDGGSPYPTSLAPACSEYITVITISYSCPSDSDGYTAGGGVNYRWSNGTFVPFEYWSDGSLSGGSNPSPCLGTSSGGRITSDGTSLDSGTDPNSCSDNIAIYLPFITAEQALNYALNSDPFFLTKVPCDQLPKWQSLAQFKPDQTVKNKLEEIDDNLLIGDVELQTIENASGTVINMDYFPVTINELPKNPLTGQKFTPSEFLNHIRKYINEFVDTQYSEFSPSLITGFDEVAIWNSSNPLGSVIHIEINGMPDGPGDGTVICSGYNSNKWIFSTIEVPYLAFVNDYDGEHPVSGNREFGFTQNTDGSYTFYTRGVDRITAYFDSVIAEKFLDDTYFEDADALWNSFKNGIYNFVIDNEGTAVAPSSQQNSFYRTDWNDIKAVLLGEKPLSDLGCK